MAGKLMPWTYTRVLVLESHEERSCAMHGLVALRKEKRVYKQAQGPSVELHAIGHMIFLTRPKRYERSAQKVDQKYVKRLSK